MSNKQYDLLSYNTWNRRLLNLYWICNVIILIVEITICIIYFTQGPSELQKPDVVSLSEYLFRYIFIPSGLTVLFTIICEILIFFLKNRDTKLQPYVVTFTCVAMCMVLIIVHYSVNVIYITCTLPFIFSLVYNDKSVLFLTFIFSLLVLIGVFMYMSLGDFMYVRFDFAEVSTSSAILVISFLICKLILNRFEEIVSILVQTERSAYETRVAKDYAEALAETRSRFLANMSHEIRTPMNGIIGLTELALGSGNFSSKEEDYLVKIKKSVIGLLDIVNDILDISKVDSGNIKLENIPFDLADTLTECEMLIADDAKQKGLRLYLYNEATTANNIIGDRTRLRQALLNILSNAVKFTRKGSVTLLVRMLENNPDSNSVSIYFEISDTGIGISNELLKEIFEPFKQADDSITRRFGGTGLGLAITKSIIEAMGGKIDVASIPSVGSRFSFSLEFGLSDNNHSFENTDKASEEQPVFVGDVLVCEDNVISRQVAKENLEKLGFNVFLAENGIDGVNIVKEHEAQGKSFEIIFMDIHMPEMDGVTATENLIELKINAPIIAMTANVMANDMETYLKTGMAECLYKPFRARELWDCLLRYLTPVYMVKIEKLWLDVDNNAPINASLGLENNIGSEDLYHKSLQIFVEEQSKILSVLKKAISESDYQLANRSAHTAKNNANVIGACRLADLSAVLEESLRRDGSYYKNDMLDDYEAELIKVLEYIPKMKIT